MPCSRYIADQDRLTPGTASMPRPGRVAESLGLPERASEGLRRHPVDEPTTRTAEHQPREPGQQQIHADEKPNRPD
jgi:hypothetical protein